MAQGWTINPVADTISFLEPPPVGTGNIVVVQNPTGGTGGTDVWALGAWSDHFGYPAETEFFGDRLWFAGTPSDPQVLWASCTGDYNNFGRSSPIVDSDALTYRINARQVNAIRDLLPLDSLIAMTTGGEYQVTGGADDPLTPSSIRAQPSGNYGSGLVPAKVIPGSGVFIQNEGQKVIEFGYQFEADGFRGTEISVWGDHLFTGYRVVGLEYWKAPWSVLWFTRNDGVRVGCTYMKEQEVIGWHWHDTQGKYLDACALPGVSETQCYYLTRREVDGQSVQFIELQAPTFYENENDLFYVDAGLTYDGTNTDVTTVTITSLTGGWTEADDLEVTASTAIFAGTSDVGDMLFLPYYVDVEQVIEGEVVLVPELRRLRLAIDTYTSGTVAGVHPVGDVPVALRNAPTPRWAFARDTIAGLWHLEGRSVVVLQDGAVAGPFTVEDGRISLAEPGAVVHVGLQYTGEIETLELNAPGGEPLRDANKLVSGVAIQVLGTRGVLAQDIAANLPPFPCKERSFETYGQPPWMRTGVVESSIPSQWGLNTGRVRILSRDPLPMEVLAITTSAAASVRPK